jgi:hypothetical protein
VKPKNSTFVSKGSELIKIDLGEIGERYVSGESLETLAEEVCISHLTLGKYLKGAGLIVPELENEKRTQESEDLEGQDEIEFEDLRTKSPEEQPGRRPWVNLSRSAQKALILKDIPHDEVVNRYRDDKESLGSIVYDLRMRNVYATEYFLKEVLRKNGVPLRKRR